MDTSAPVCTPRLGLQVSFVVAAWDVVGAPAVSVVVVVVCVATFQDATN